ncbi:nucleotidyltransferase domain-containing protein [Microbacterium arborescens]
MLSDADLLRFARDLAAIPGVVAVALGGSRARGAHSPDSDVDLGVYVDGRRVDRAALSATVSRWATTPVMIGPAGSWGPWVDSGAWATIAGMPLDVIIRDADRVRAQVARARRGEFAFHAQPGHPLGFLDVAYAGEVALAKPLVDDAGFLRDHAAALAPYPEPLRRAFLDDLWQVDFLVDAAAKVADRGDTAYIGLCLSNAAVRLAYAWHAQARTWAINEKGVVSGVPRLPSAPADFDVRVAAALSALDASPEGARAAVEMLRALPRPS